MARVFHFLSLTVFSALIVGGFSGTVFAQEAKSPATDRGEIVRQKIIKQVDTNKDGYIGADENIAAAKKRFSMIDTNKDGFLTVPEVTKSAEDFIKKSNKNEKNSKRHVKGIERQIASMDANQDGKVSEAEYTGRIGGLFADQDADGNGKVSSAEMKEYSAKRFAAMKAKKAQSEKEVKPEATPKQ